MNVTRKKVKISYLLIIIFVGALGYGVLTTLSQDVSPLGQGIYGPLLWSPYGTYLAISFDSGDRHELWLLETAVDELNKLEEKAISLSGCNSGLIFPEKLLIFNRNPLVGQGAVEAI